MKKNWNATAETTPVILPYSATKVWVKWMPSSFGRLHWTRSARVLKRVEIEDASMASEVTEMLMGSEVGPRRQFIYEHADEAEIDA